MSLKKIKKSELEIKSLLKQPKKKSFWDKTNTINWIIFICIVVLLVLGSAPVYLYWTGQMFEEKFEKLDVLSNLDKLENITDPCQCNCNCYEEIVVIENITETKVFVVNENRIVILEDYYYEKN